LSARWFVLDVVGIFTLLLLVIPGIASVTKHKGPATTGWTILGIVWAVLVGLTVAGGRRIQRQGVVAEGDHIWVRTGRRWHGPLYMRDVLAVDLIWARGAGYVYYFISPTVGERLTWRAALGSLGAIRPSKYRNAHDGPLRYVVIPQWANRDGTLFRMIMPGLTAQGTVRFNGLALRLMMGGAGIKQLERPQQLLGNNR
jgi:hypothetical protein